MDSSSRFRRLAELVGVIGLILSLVFVGLEVRQNTRVAKAEAYRAFATQVSEWYSRMTDPEFAELVNRAMGGASLTSSDRIQIFAFHMVLFRA